MKNRSALPSVDLCCRYNVSDEKQCFAKAHNADFACRPQLKTPNADGWCDVGFWHKADMLNPLTKVRFWEQTGHLTNRNHHRHDILVCSLKGATVMGEGSYAQPQWHLSRVGPAPHDEARPARRSRSCFPIARTSLSILRISATSIIWRLPALGFTDDAAVLTALFGLSSHITPVHRAAAARALGKKIRRT